MEKGLEEVILDEAQGANHTAQRILALMQQPTEDPITMILRALAEITTNQETVLTKLDILEQRLTDLARNRTASPR